MPRQINPAMPEQHLDAILAVMNSDTADRMQVGMDGAREKYSDSIY